MSGALSALYEESKNLLIENRELLDRVAEALLERETLDTTDLRALMDGEPLPPLPAPDAEEPEPQDPESSKDEDDDPILSGKKLPDPEPMPS